MISDYQRAQEHKNKGNEYFKAGNWEESLKEYEIGISISLNSKDEEKESLAILYSNASAAALKLGLWGPATILSNEALCLQPSFEKALYRNVQALIGLKKFVEAKNTLIRLSKEHPQTWCPARKEMLQGIEKEIYVQSFSDAIHIEKFSLQWKHIKKLSIPSTYSGPSLGDDDKIDFSFIKQMASFYRKGEEDGNVNILHPRHAFRIMMEAKDIFSSFENVVRVNFFDEIAICGDIHGQFWDLLNIFEVVNGYPSDLHHKTYIFNGDIVDRGSCSVEVFLFLCALKIVFPNNLYITRGNHESESINRMHGFWEECQTKYDSIVGHLLPSSFSLFYNMANIVLSTLPLAHLVMDKLFVVHGGLPMGAENVSIADLSQIQRFITVPQGASVMSQLLWSDPQTMDGYSPSHRGEGVLFGPDITKAFLKHNSLTHLIRSHVWEIEGYKVEHDGHCITIFSAPNYMGEGQKSPGALILLRKEDFITMTPGCPLNYLKYNASSFQGIPKDISRRSSIGRY